MNMKELPYEPQYTHPTREGRIWGEFKLNLGAKPGRRALVLSRLLKVLP